MKKKTRSERRRDVLLLNYYQASSLFVIFWPKKKEGRRKEKRLKLTFELDLRRAGVVDWKECCGARKNGSESSRVGQRRVRWKGRQRKRNATTDGRREGKKVIETVGRKIALETLVGGPAPGRAWPRPWPGRASSKLNRCIWRAQALASFFSLSFCVF